VNAQNEQLIKDVENYVHEVDSLIKNCRKVFESHGHNYKGSITYWFELCNDSTDVWQINCDLLLESIYTDNTPRGHLEKIGETSKFGAKHTNIKKYYQNKKIIAVIKKVHFTSVISRNPFTRHDNEVLENIVLYISDDRIIYHKGDIDDDDIKKIIQKYNLQFCANL